MFSLRKNPWGVRRDKNFIADAAAAYCRSKVSLWQECDVIFVLVWPFAAGQVRPACMKRCKPKMAV
jgi:hypothetical protein